MSESDVVDGSHHRHCKLPNFGVDQRTPNVSYWLQADLQSPEIDFRSTSEPLSQPPPRQGTIGCEKTAVRHVGRPRRPAGEGPAHRRSVSRATETRTEALSSGPVSINCSMSASMLVPSFVCMPVLHGRLVSFMENQDDGSPRVVATFMPEELERKCSAIETRQATRYQIQFFGFNLIHTNMRFIRSKN